VLDPAALLGGDPAYLLDLLAWRDADEGSAERWRLIVLEDAGELVCAHAPDAALASLLNLTDGVLGHGTRTLVAVTTNEPIRRIHPAILRPGRCMSELEFGAFSPAEGRAWIARGGHDAHVTQALSLSELYALIGDGNPTRLATRPAFGFGRALR
jgi:hypothetical protein